MRCWSVLLLACACSAKDPATAPTPKPEPAATDDADDGSNDEDEVPRDIPSDDTDETTEDTASGDTDTGLASEGSDDPPEDSGLPTTDSGSEASIDIEIETGHRWVGRFYPATMFGEIRWETANPDGTRCLIEGLLVDITEFEESCSDCDFGIEFTITGLAVLLDEGGCDSTVLDKEGTQMEFGHGHTQIHTEADSDVFDLYRLDLSGWHALESGFSLIETSESFAAGTWVFGEELDATTESDSAISDGLDSSTP